MSRLYRKIMVPVDLRHPAAMRKAIATAADLSRLYEADILFISVTASAPGQVAHDAEEFATTLHRFAEDAAREHGVAIDAHAIVSADPAVELDSALREAIRAQGADLVVMASHVPGIREYFISSNAGWLGAHADVSVFVVR